MVMVAKGVGRQQAAVMKKVSAVVMMRVPMAESVVMMRVPMAVAMVVVCRFNKKKK